MPRIILMKGPARTKLLDLCARETSIGRASSNDVVLDSMEVSRRHAVVRIDGSVVTIHDFDSSNGVFVNGIKVRSQVLVGGDEISIGAFKIRYLSDGHKVPTDTLRLVSPSELLTDRDRTGETSLSKGFA